MRTFNQLALLLSKLASHRAGKPLAAYPGGAPASFLQGWDPPRLGKKRLVVSPRLRSYSPRCKTRGLLSGIIYLYANKMSIPGGRLKKNPAFFSAPEGLGTLFTGSLHPHCWPGQYFRAPSGNEPLKRERPCFFYFLFHRVPWVSRVSKREGDKNQ